MFGEFICKIGEGLEWAMMHPELLTAIFTLCLVIVTIWLVRVARSQLHGFRDQVRADFLYRICRDLESWLKDHKEARDWIFNKLDKEKLGRTRFDEWEFDDYLVFFETIWSFDKKHLVDKDIVYDLLSDYLVSVYEANDYELKEIIEQLRIEEEKDDLYEGVVELYKEMKDFEEAKQKKVS